MKNTFTNIFYLVLFFSFLKIAKSNIFEINPNKTTDSFSTDKSTDSELKQFFQDTKPITTITTTGYLTISTLNRVISYPFSEKALTVKVFYKEGMMMLKDLNDLILWTYKFDEGIIDEVEFLTFINRGTMLAQDSENLRIWPFEEEKLYKKLNLSLSNGNLDISNENNNKIWSYSVKSVQRNDPNFLENVELIRL